MTDSISVHLREVGEDAKKDTPDILWNYPEVLFDAADHIDAQAATIKALVEALNDYISDTAYGGNVEADTAENARTALAAAKEPT